MTAIWFDVLPGDSRDQWDPALLTDHRVTQYWDQDLEIAEWFEEHESEIGFSNPTPSFVWDAYLLFGPGAAWQDVPRPLVSFGRTVLAAADDLEKDLDALWQVTAGSLVSRAGTMTD